MGTVISRDTAVFDPVVKNEFDGEVFFLTEFGLILAQNLTSDSRHRSAYSAVTVKLRSREVVVAKSTPDDIVYLKLVILSKFLLPIVLSYLKNAFGKSKKNQLTLSSVPGFAHQRRRLSALRACTFPSLIAQFLKPDGHFPT